MAFIQDIVSAETEASRIVAEAHTDAKRLLADAEQSRTMKVAETRTALLKEEETKLADQKQELADTYKKTYESGHAEGDDIVAHAKQSERKAVTKIVETILG